MSREIKNKLFSSQLNTQYSILNTHTFHCLLCPSGHGRYTDIENKKKAEQVLKNLLSFSYI